MSKADYYDLLGVSRGASDAEIKSAFRKKAKQHHPDRNKGDKGAEQKFKDINEAYETLKDGQKRAQYDQFGHAGMGAGFNSGGGGAGGGFDFGGMGGFSDIFNDIFGDTMGGGPSSQQKRDMSETGGDLRYNIEITLEEAFAGAKKDIKFKGLSKCDVCDGKGAKNPSDVQNCGTCKGSGRVRMQQGFFMVERACSTCHGAGKIIKNPCTNCHGQGRVEKTRNISIQIPAGIEDGMKMRVAGEGEAGLRGGRPGDLYAFIYVKSHELFARDSSNLHCTIPIKVTTAILGGAIDIASIDGKSLKVTIPEGAQSGSKLRLRGKGMPVLQRSQFGDLIIKLQVETPRNLSKSQRELLMQLDETLNESSNPDSSGFLKKVKSFLKFG